MAARVSVLVRKYDAFVAETDQTADRSVSERLDIAIYGLVGEIGSLVSAIKKRLKYSDDDALWNIPNEEIIEELGDIAWYCFALARAANPKAPVNILTRSIVELRRALKDGPGSDGAFQDALGPERCKLFLKRSRPFPVTESMTFDDYQRVAVLTARTSGEELRDVCISVLWQAGAELLRHKLPDIELKLNKSVIDSPINTTLGTIAWHVAVLADLYGVSLDEVVAANMRKVSARRNRGEPTPLHDEPGRRRIPSHERLPRHVEISFITVGRGRSRMYVDGKQLGDELTDNAYEADGYRFHDILHLANMTKLGWSPVLRKLFSCKRKSDKELDEVEDGARAGIVEEAVIMAIYSEGVRLSGRKGRKDLLKTRLFPDARLIPFALLQRIHNFVEGLEVHSNQLWEWEDAIMIGYEIFHKLNREGQGTVTIDLPNRSLRYRPTVYVDIKGTLTAVGNGEACEAEWEDAKSIEELTADERAACATSDAPGATAARYLAAKRGIRDALDIAGIRRTSGQLQLVFLDNHRVSVKASGAVQAAMWKQKAISFKVDLKPSGDAVACTVYALADPKD